jgi:hypothetical protein
VTRDGLDTCLGLGTTYDECSGWGEHRMEMSSGGKLQGAGWLSVMTMM